MKLVEELARNCAEDVLKAQSGAYDPTELAIAAFIQGFMCAQKRAEERVTAVIRNLGERGLNE